MLAYNVNNYFIVGTTLGMNLRSTCEYYDTFISVPIGYGVKLSVYCIYSVCSVMTMADRLVHKRSTVSRLMLADDLKLFWDRFKALFPEERQQVWDGLMFGLQKYHEILKGNPFFAYIVPARIFCVS